MPENINFQKNLADFYCIELGRIEEALKIYVSILTTHPQDIETLLATGQICAALEKPADAKDFFQPGSADRTVEWGRPPKFRRIGATILNGRFDECRIPG